MTGVPVLQRILFPTSAKKINFKSGLFASCAIIIATCLTAGNAFAQTNVASISPMSQAISNSRPILSDTDKARLKAAVTSSLRIDNARDKYRHPEETLELFGIKSDATVVEIWPGQGWYTSILGPYLKLGGGHLIAANYDTSTSNSEIVDNVVDNFDNVFISHPDLYGDVKQVPFGPRSDDLAAPNSVDAVVTFRNVNNWMSQGWSDKAFQDFFKVLKPGGILGVEENRQDDDVPQDPLAADGYVRQDYVISLAKDAGFELVETSEINANPKDTKDHPFGVLTLPPTLITAPIGQASNPRFNNGKYKQIGESDRMTLVFRKPLINDAPKKMATSEPKPVPVIFKDSKSKAKTSNAKVATKTPVKVAVKVNDAASTEDSSKPVNLIHAVRKLDDAPVSKVEDATNKATEIATKVAETKEEIKTTSPVVTTPVLAAVPLVANAAPNAPSAPATPLNALAIGFAAAPAAALVATKTEEPKIVEAPKTEIIEAAKQATKTEIKPEIKPEIKKEIDTKIDETKTAVKPEVNKADKTVSDAAAKTTQKVIDKAENAIPKLPELPPIDDKADAATKAVIADESDEKPEVKPEVKAEEKPKENIETKAIEVAPKTATKKAVVKEVAKPAATKQDKADTKTAKTATTKEVKAIPKPTTKAVTKTTAPKTNTETKLKGKTYKGTEGQEDKAKTTNTKSKSTAKAAVKPTSKTHSKATTKKTATKADTKEEDAKTTSKKAVTKPSAKKEITSKAKAANKSDSSKASGKKTDEKNKNIPDWKTPKKK